MTNRSAGGSTVGLSHLRIGLGGRNALGPGKADLLEAIRDTGSIAAAGRHLGMSYKRAWTLVETLNASFREPVVASSRGGSGRGGAHLTHTGTTVLALYRSMQREAETAIEDEMRRLVSLLAPDLSHEK